MGHLPHAAAQTQPETTLVPHGTTITHPSRLRRRVGRQQLAQGAVQSQTEVFEYVQADILLPYLDPIQRGFRQSQLPGEVMDCERPPVGRWRHRSLTHGLNGLQDAPRSGRPRRFSPL